jgi:hypothetical protein
MRARAPLAALLLLSASATTPFAGAGAADDTARKTAADSFLFSGAALARIEAARAGRAWGAPAGVARSSPAPATGAIHLGAIVYRAPDDWRVWLNGESFTPGARAGAIEILQVSAERVVIAWRPGPGARPARIELRPNQTYVVASGAVVEGNPGSGR